MSEYFRITTGGQVHAPGPDDTLVVLHRSEVYQDLDYFSFADHEAREMITILDSPEAARWIAGLAWDGLRWVVPEIRGKTFHERFGWNPEAIIVRQVAEESIEDQWVDLQIKKDVFLGQLVIPHE